jgi:hypothetical protein
VSWIKSIWVGCWLCLFSAFLAEQTLIPSIVPELKAPISSGSDYSHFDQASELFCSFTLQSRGLDTAPAPVIREPFLKWKSFIPERFLNLGLRIKQYPEFVQDLRHCPAVAIVLFPYHEFL